MWLIIQRYHLLLRTDLLYPAGTPRNLYFNLQNLILLFNRMVFNQKVLKNKPEHISTEPDSNNQVLITLTISIDFFHGPADIFSQF